MESLNKMNNVAKAKLLHNLMTGEIPAFIDYLKEQAQVVTKNSEELRANWSGQMFGADFWLQLAEETIKKINTYGKELKRSANVFGDQLFDGYLAVFTSHVLTYYVTNEEKIDIKFKQAVELFFN
jgi:hypothetical protein